MIEYDDQDDDGFGFTHSDKIQLEDLLIGQSMEAENGSFVVVRQKQYHIWCSRGKKTGVYILPSLEKVLEFLYNNHK